MEYYSTIKKDEVLIPQTTSTDLENVMPSERRKIQKVYDSIRMKYPGSKSREIGSRLWGAGSWGAEGMGVPA